MSKTSVAGIAAGAKPRSGGEDAGREIAIAAIADDHDDGRIRHLLRDPEPDLDRAAGRDPGEDALFACEPPRHLLGVGLADVLEPVDAPRVVDLREVRLGPLADARDLRAFRRLAPDDLDPRVLLLQEAARAHDRASRPHARDEVRDAAFGVAPDLRPSALVVRARVVGIGELVEHDALPLR